MPLALIEFLSSPSGYIRPLPGGPRVYVLGEPLRGERHSFPLCLSYPAWRMPTCQLLRRSWIFFFLVTPVWLARTVHDYGTRAFSGNMVSLSIIYQNHSQVNGLGRISGERRNYICWFRLPFLLCLLLRLRLRFQRLLLIRVTELCHPIILIGVLSWFAVSVLLQDSIPSNLMDQTPPTTDDQVSSEIASNMSIFHVTVFTGC
ncbi:hypothetical protein CDAR_456231 [Caerostris darwini]|uniref:Uncharacterized protein n=1 Tax=Caerostris darwini TaxID=1538125 RepID=A0AAV4Q2F3_9ARAC|nr:hypothetical protein CDAR_456231 [Caerostris darwini]